MEDQTPAPEPEVCRGEGGADNIPGPRGEERTAEIYIHRIGDEQAAVFALGRDHEGRQLGSAPSR